MPVQRTLAINYPHDPKIYDGHYHNQYLFGPYFMVIPVESTKDFVKVYLPEGDWYYLYTGKKYTGNSELILECPVHKLPVFVKAGAIIPMEAARSNTQEKNDLLRLHIYKDVSNSSFVYYEDDGVTFDYQNGNAAKRLIDCKPLLNKIILHQTEGSYKSSFKKIRLVLHGFEKSLHTLYVNNHGQQLEEHTLQLFTGLEKYDPIKDPDPAPEEEVLVTEFDYVAGEISIHW